MVRHATDAHRPVLLTSRGRGAAVVQSLSDFEEAEEERAFMRTVFEGLADLEEGREVPLAEAKARFGLKKSMPVARISFAEAALSDPTGTQAWYGKEGVPEVEDRFVSQIFERVETLAEHPDVGRMVPEFGQPFLRELIRRPFRIVYRREPRRVRIVRI